MQIIRRELVRRQLFSVGPMSCVVIEAHGANVPMSTFLNVCFKRGSFPNYMAIASVVRSQAEERVVIENLAA